jgi:hypothetical protein
MNAILLQIAAALFDLVSRFFSREAVSNQE